MKLSICSFDVSNFTIVLSPDYSPAEKTAARFIKRVIKKSCGVDLNISTTPVVHSIFIGGFDAPDEVKWDGFCISTDDADIYLRGKIARGTLYSCYYFAEHFLGFRHFSIDTEIIPTEGTVIIERNYYKVNNPAIEGRKIDWIGVTNYPENASFLRINGIDNGEEYGGSFHTEKITVDLDSISIKSNKGFNDILNKVIDKLDNNHQIKILDFTLKNYKGTTSNGAVFNSLVKLANYIYDQIKLQYSDIIIQIPFADFKDDSLKGVFPYKNVVVKYSTDKACFRHPIFDEDYINGNIEICNNIKILGAMFDKVSIDDYSTNFSCFLAPYPNIEVLRRNIKFFAKNNVRYFSENTVPGSWTGEFNELKCYIISKLMWNPYMSEHNYNFYIDEFLKAYYGPGWEKVKNYIQLELELTKNYHMGIYEDVDRMHYIKDTGENKEILANYFPEAYQEVYLNSYLKDYIDNINKFKELWLAATKSAKTEIQKMHIERSKMSFDYVDLFCREHNKKNMTESEQSIYEKEVQNFKDNIEKFNIKINVWNT